MENSGGSIIVDWISNNIGALLTSIYNGMVQMIINPIIDGIGYLIFKCVTLLPYREMRLSDITTIIDSSIMAQINWFIPFDVLPVCFDAIVACITCYYLIFPALRWVKLVK